MAIIDYWVIDDSISVSNHDDFSQRSEPTPKRNLESYRQVASMVSPLSSSGCMTYHTYSPSWWELGCRRMDSKKAFYYTTTSSSSNTSSTMLKLAILRLKVHRMKKSENEVSKTG